MLFFSEKSIKYHDVFFFLECKKRIRMKVEDEILYEKYCTNLLKISLSSCSETNWPKLATNRVEQGALLTAMLGCEDEEPTGDAKAGEGKKCGNEA